MKNIILGIFIVCIMSSTLSATPRKVSFDQEYLLRLVHEEQELKANGATVAKRRSLETPIELRFSAPFLGRVKAVFPKVRRFSTGAEEPWLAVYFQGELKRQDGSTEPLTMTVFEDHMVIFPLLDKRGRAVDVRIPIYGELGQQSLYRMKKRRDADWHASFQHCATATDQHSISELFRPEVAAATVNVVTFELEGDAELVTAESNTSSYLNSIFSTVEQIYERDLALTFSIEKEEIFSKASTQPYTSSVGETLLNQVKDNNTSESVDLTHLITGKDIYLSTPGDGLAGIAFTGVVCNKSFNVGLSERSSSKTTTSVTVAHEVGHNFGGSHPTETEGFIMDAVGTPTTKSEFSTFSQNEIAQFINQTATCLAEETLNEPSLSVSTDRKKGLITFDVRFSEDRSACTFAVQLAPNQAFSGNARTFDGFTGGAATAQVTGSKKRKSKKAIFARVVVNCSGTEIESDPVSIPKVKKIRSKKPKLGFKKWMKLKNVTQLA